MPSNAFRDMAEVLTCPNKAAHEAKLVTSIYRARSGMQRTQAPVQTGMTLDRSMLDSMRGANRVRRMGDAFERRLAEAIEKEEAKEAGRSGAGAKASSSSSAGAVAGAAKAGKDEKDKEKEKEKEKTAKKEGDSKAAGADKAGKASASADKGDKSGKATPAAGKSDKAASAASRPSPSQAAKSKTKGMARDGSDSDDSGSSSDSSKASGDRGRKGGSASAAGVGSKRPRSQRPSGSAAAAAGAGGPAASTISLAEQTLQTAVRERASAGCTGPLTHFELQDEAFRAEILRRAAAVRAEGRAGPEASWPPLSAVAPTAGSARGATSSSLRGVTWLRGAWFCRLKYATFEVYVGPWDDTVAAGVTYDYCCSYLRGQMLLLPGQSGRLQANFPGSVSLCTVDPPIDPWPAQVREACEAASPPVALPASRALPGEEDRHAPGAPPATPFGVGFTGSEGGALASKFKAGAAGSHDASAVKRKRPDDARDASEAGDGGMVDLSGLADDDDDGDGDGDVAAAAASAAASASASAGSASASASSAGTVPRERPASSYIGVQASKNAGVGKAPMRWAARISDGGVHKHLGTFDVEIDAAAAYDRAAASLRGDRAILNFAVREDGEPDTSTRANMSVKLASQQRAGDDGGAGAGAGAAAGRASSAALPYTGPGAQCVRPVIDGEVALEAAPMTLAQHRARAEAAGRDRGRGAGRGSSAGAGAGAASSSSSGGSLPSLAALAVPTAAGAVFSPAAASTSGSRTSSPVLPSSAAAAGGSLLSLRPPTTSASASAAASGRTSPAEARPVSR